MVLRAKVQVEGANHEESRPCGKTAHTYVARVHEGREEASARALINLIESDVLAGCFVPWTERLYKRSGRWVSAERLLYPGYVFVSTTAPRNLDRRMRALSIPVQLVGRQRTRYIPLSDTEEKWFGSVLDSSHTLRASTGVIQSGKLEITQGPLKGYESRVKKINRHKALALVELAMPDKPVLVKASLLVPHKS